MNYIEILGLIAGACSAIAFIPQVLHIWRSRSTKDISLKMYLIYCGGVVMWVIYGLLQAAPSIIIANMVMLVLSISILIMKIKFR